VIHPVPLGTRIQCPNCHVRLRYAIVDEEPADIVVVNCNCPNCNHVINLEDHHA
jgi:hypothetical protein